MKQQFTAILLVLSLLLTMAGCSAAGAARALDRAEDRVEEKLDAAEDSMENAVQKAVIPTPAGVPEENTVTSTGPAFNPITREEAEQIALDYLQLTRDQVRRLHTEYEIDNGICHYDVQFQSGDRKYEFEISAESGKILSYDRDSQYD